LISLIPVGHQDAGVYFPSFFEGSIKASA